MTLFEVSVVTVIMGILAAIGTPSMMGMIQGDRVEQGLNQVKSALQEGQKQAMRRSMACTISFNKTADPPTITASNGECLVFSETELPNNVAMKTTSSLDSGVTFSFKGNSVTSGTIVIEPKKLKATDEKLCLVIASGLGIMRSGIYTGDTTASISADNCQTSK